MTKTFKKSVSILLAAIMILSVFTIVPMSAGAAPADFSSDTKTVFVTDSQNWDGGGVLKAYYWKVETTGYDSNWNPITQTVAGDWVDMTYLYDNSQSPAQSVYGVQIPDDANWVLFSSQDKSVQTADTKNVYDGSWWYIDGSNACQPCSGDVFDTCEQTGSLSAAFVTNTGADEFYVLDGRYYFIDSNGNISQYNNVHELYVAKNVATGNWFTTVNAAVAEAGEDGSVQLVADIVGNVGIDGDYTTTLDLNGHNITNATGTAITLYSAYPGGKTFTIKDTEGTGTVTSTRKYNGDACISDSSGREVVIEGGNYVANAGTSGEGQALYVSSDNGWTINGGTFNGDIKVVSELDVTGGTINGNINATGPSWTVDPAEVTISGGTVNGSLNSENDSTYEVSGGTFSEPVPAAFCAEGYIPAYDETTGTYGVTEGTFAAEVNGDKYVTFAEAVDARTSNDDVITLLNAAGTYTSDDHTEFPIKVAKNGKSVTVKIEDAPYYTDYSTADGVTTFVAIEGKVKYTATNGTVTYKGNIDYSNMGGSGTYQLLDNITANSRIVPGLFASNVTIDLNGYTLTSTATDEAFLFSRAGSTASHNSYTITNGTIIAPGDGIQLLADYADLTLDGVTVNAAGDYGIVTNGTKTGNNITVTDSDISGGAAGIYKPSNGTLTLTDTDVEGNVAVYVKSGTVAINGGTFTGTGAKADYTYNGNGINPTGDAIVIDSCGYPGGAPSVSIGGNPTITSTNGVEIGDYAGNGVTELAAVTATDNSLTLPTGLKWVETEAGSGVYEVAPDYVATVNGDGYMTFAEAVAARTGTDDVIVLIKNAGTYTMGAVSEAPIKVQKDGKTVTVKAPDGEPYVVSSSTEGNVTTYTAAAAKVKYTNLQGVVSYSDSLPSAFSSGTYQLLDDITRTTRMTPGIFGSNVTLDLNGHTLNSTAKDSAILLSRAGTAASHYTFTLTDTSENGGKLVANNLQNTGSSNTASVISASGNYNDITIENVTIEATQGIALIGSNQTLTIDNSDITITGTDFALATNGSLTNGAVIDVTDSSIESTAGIGVYLPGGSTATFTDTDVTGTTAMYIKSGDTTIDGGTYTATGAAAEFTHNGNGANATGDAIVVESCNYPNGVPTVSIGADDIVSANGVQVGDYTYGEQTASADVTSTSNDLTLPEGLKWVETATAGVYEVGPDYAAEVNGDGYMTFEEAVAARATDDDVIILLKNYSGTYNMEPGKLVVDKNGCTFAKPTVTGAYIVGSTNSGTVYTFTTTEAAIEYTSLSGAVSYKSNIDYSNLGSSGTYKLLKDITCNSRIVPGLFASNVTIDLNGHTLTSNATDEAFLFSRAGSAASHNSYTITNGTIIAPGDGIQLLADYADLTLDGVTVNAAGDYGIVTNGTKTGNNITVTDSDISGGAAGIYKPSNGTLTLTDTDVEGNVAVYVKSGTVAINGGTFTGTGAKADYTYNGNGINPTGDAIVIDSCGYPGGAPSVSIGGNPTITSTNGVEIGDYAGNGVTELAAVTATDNSLTLPEGLSWIETETPGIYKVGHVHDYNIPSFNWTQDANTGEWDCDTLTLSCSCGAYQEYEVTGFFGASAVTCTANDDGSFTYSVSKKVDGVTYSDTKTLDADGVIKSNKQLSAAAKKGGSWELGNGLEGVTNISCADGFVLDGNDYVIKTHTSVKTNPIFRSANKTATYTLKNLTIDGGVGETQFKPAISSATTASGQTNVINLENVNIINYDFDADNNGAVLAFGQATVNLTNCDIDTDSQYDVWAGAKGTVNIDDGTYGDVYLHGGTASATVDGDADVDSVVLGYTTYGEDSTGMKVTVNDGLVAEITNLTGNEIEKEQVVMDPENAAVGAPEGYEWVDSEEEGMKTLSLIQENLFLKHSISVNGYINLNFYLNDKLVGADTVVNFAWSVNGTDKSASYTLKATDLYPGYGYKATVSLPAAEMKYGITASVDGFEETNTYSVRDYCDVILSDEYEASYVTPELYPDRTYANLEALVLNMLDYGAKAQTAFDRTDVDLANKGVEFDRDYTDLSYTDVEAAIKAANGGVAGDDPKDTADALGIKYYTSTVIFLSGNTLRHYFTPNTWPSDMPYEEDFDGNQSNYYYYVETTDIAAAQLDKLQEYTIGSETFNYSALDYCKTVLQNGTMDAKFLELAASTYWYNQAANAYFGANA